jgi:hypothetical protein
VRRPLLLLGIVTALAAPPIAAARSTSASAATTSAVPCRDRVYNDWYADGKIATTYALSCYRTALAHLNGSADLVVYSSLGDDIRLALAAAVRRQHDAAAPREVGKGFTSDPSRAPSSALPPGSAPTVTATTPTAPPPRRRPGKGSAPNHATDARDRLTATTVASSAAPSLASGSSDGTPVPLLVLGGFALALLAAGGVGAGVRLRRRRSSS